MSMRINHNLLALQAHRNLQLTQRALDKAVQRLSSGLRINNAADDPAGLAISEKMRAHIASLEQATRNANYGMNLLQTAEGAMSVIDEKLVRMRQLAVEAATGTMSDEDRTYADTEFQALKSEITRIAQVTEYNGKKLLDGTFSVGNVLHIGIHNVDNKDKLTVDLNNMTATALGLADALNISTMAMAQSAITMVDSAIESKDTARTNVGAYIERLTNAITNLQISTENAVASESQIRDADIALEMANFVRAQILQRAGVSMMAQANMVPQTVAAILSGP
ncbi:MAG: flagellin [Candidatus Latescibacterota bacterium]|nr:MAG: flagellin [Candidatus Latescibacterota bacterium]RKY73162.1 MAG: flagellin [Candidatus Latescibacterota bacterium]